MRHPISERRLPRLLYIPVCSRLQRRRIPPIANQPKVSDADAHLSFNVPETEACRRHDSVVPFDITHFH